MARAVKQWHLLPADPAAANRLARAAQISPVVAQLLINRDIREPATARRFLDAPLSDLLPPACLPGVDEAAERIVKAISAKRKICIYGDYDVDGVTGTAILYRLFKELGADVQYHTPSRLSEGYGLHSDRLRELAGQGVSLVLSVDCGIASISEAKLAHDLGIELIVTDHHEPKMGQDGPLLPSAAVVVHPRLPGSAYPYGDLSGAGVAFKLAWAVAQRASGSERVQPALREILLDGIGLAALGLVADVVSLREENRIFVRHGLERIRKQPLIGLEALIRAARIKIDRGVTSEDVGYRLAPRLNAAGRLGCARLAVELLTTASLTRCNQIAEHLERQNNERQARERRYTQHAKEMVEYEFRNDPAIVVGSPDWHPGIIGIVASRLADHFGKPALVVALPTDKSSIATGSGRSIPGFPLHQALQACDELLEGHGGHAAAAGFKLKPEFLPALRDRLNAYVAKYFPSGAPLPRLVLDTEIPLSALTPGLMNELDKLEPYGAGNPRPKFLAVGLRVEAARLIGSGETQKHVDFRVRQGDTVLRCVAWNMADRVEELQTSNAPLSLAFSPKINEWNGQRKIELQVLDFAYGNSPPLV